MVTVAVSVQRRTRDVHSRLEGYGVALQERSSGKEVCEAATCHLNPARGARTISWPLPLKCKYVTLVFSTLSSTRPWCLGSRSDC